MLEELYAGSLADASRRSELVTVADLETAIASLAPARNVFETLDTDTVCVIAEIKRASPSKGYLADIPSAASLAVEYEAAGAKIISVLTEERKFNGSLNDLTEVSQKVTCPVLRKDFIGNEYQILEARANGADLILLIVAGLSTARLTELYSFANQLGLAVLVETHSEQEFEQALSLGAKLIGVNARDLRTFETDRHLFDSIASQAPSGVVLVAESAVRNLADVQNYARSGADAVLVGEALVTGDHKTLIGEFSQVPKNRL